MESREKGRAGRRGKGAPFSASPKEKITYFADGRGPSTTLIRDSYQSLVRRGGGSVHKGGKEAHKDRCRELKKLSSVKSSWLRLEGVYRSTKKEDQRIGEYSPSGEGWRGRRPRKGRGLVREGGGQPKSRIKGQDGTLSKMSP